MKTKRCNIQVPKRIGFSPKWFRLLDDFTNSPDVVVELVPDPGEYKSLQSMQSSACVAIQRYGFAISTMRKDEKLYLVKDIREDNI